MSLSLHCTAIRTAHKIRVNWALAEEIILLDKLISEVTQHFPDLSFRVDSKKRQITIPSGNKDIGDLLVYDDTDELTVYVGSFTHWHASASEGDTKNHDTETVELVIEFLSDLIQDQIVMWGNGESLGGFYNINKDEAEQDTPLKAEVVKKYVWSGREIS